MMAVPRSALIALACVTGLCFAARAQQIPAPEDGDKVVTTKFLGDKVEMRDAASGAPIMIPYSGIELWEDKNNANSLAPTIAYQPQPAGFDVIYTFNNTGPDARTLGTLDMGILTLGHRVDYPDLRYICEPKYADYNEGYKVRQMQYPDTTYSPAWILENSDYAVGISLQFPILEYKHSVRLSLVTPEGKYAGGEGGRGWKIEFLLSNLGNETDINKLRFPGAIAPGETRTYVVSVRVTKKPTEWVRTLVPYRNWFRGQYGGVAYTRRGKCINARSITDNALCTDDNPYGFGDSRQDKNGWGNFVGSMMARKNWDTLLFITPSGSYRYNNDSNMPFQFTTNWNANGPLATAYDPAIGFPRLPAAGQKIGFWWGHSAQVANQWDDPTLAPLDPTNPTHRKLAFAEMDLAIKAGATTVGLDTFDVMVTPIWELVPWIQELKSLYPGVRFCAEPVCSDLMHREVPTFYRGNKDRWEIVKPEDIDGFYNPHFLADFLLPGHEIWGSFRWSAYQDIFGITFTDEEKTEKLRQIASLGYTPCALEVFDLQDPTIEAADSWKYTVPPDLQIPADGPDPFPTFALFDSAFKSGAPAADLNRDGKLNFFDYTAWQNLHLPGGKGDGGRNDDQTVSRSGPAPVGGEKQDARHTAKAAGRAPVAPKKMVRNGKPAKIQRLEIKVTGANPTGPAVAPGPSRPGFFINASPITFTDAEIAAALARARGQDDSSFAAPATPTAPDSK